MASLFEQFIKEEGLPLVRWRVLGAVREREGNPRREIREFNFNRFNLTLDFVGNVAVIIDILDMNPDIGSEVRLPLDEFIRRLSPA